MSDIQFYCSQCGQHVTAGDDWAGRQISCPKCQMVLTVPGRAPALPPLIQPVLLAAQPPPNRPQPVPTTPRPAKGARLWVWIVLCLCIIGVELASILGFLALNYYKDSQKPSPPVTIMPEEKPLPPIVVKMEPPKTEVPVATSDLASRIIPDTPVSGILRDQPFGVETATIASKSILLRQGNGLIPDASLRFFLFLQPDEQLDGRKFLIEPGVKVRIRPHIHVSRKEGPNGGLKTEIVSSNYSLRLEFGERQGNKLPGRIYLEMAEHLGTKVAGTFEATVTP